MIQQALVAVTLMGGVAVVGCAPRGSANAEAEALPQVQFFRTSPPVCPYARIGEISAGRASTRSVAEEIRAAGGDALVMTNGGVPPAAGAAPRGIIIRFTDPACTH